MEQPAVGIPDRWERQTEAIGQGVPYLLLAVATTLALLQGERPWAEHLITLAIATLTALWMFVLLTWRPAWARHRATMAIYFAGLLALIAALLWRSPWAGIFATTGYIHAWEFLPGRWRLAGVAATAALAATSFTGGLPQRDAAAIATYLIFVLAIVTLVALFSTIGETTRRQNQQRKAIIAELAATNDRLETILAENAGLHSQLLAQAREAGILDERQRMAREIHDTLAQGFTGIIAQLEAAKRVRREPDQWQPHLDRAQTLARDSLAEARRSVQALRPAPLEQSRLPEALADMAERWSETAAVPLSIATVGEPRPLPPEAEVALFRVAQEALNNVARHAHASRAGLTLSYTDSLVLLDVRDDGVGFATHGTNGHDDPRRGFGLGTMADRLRLVGGDLEIETAPGEGTSLNARVPALPLEGGA